MAESNTPLPTVTAATLLAAAPAPVVVDLRSPAEFAEDHVPGAVNVPLFDNTARALVGTLYKQVSPDAAFREARELTRQRIQALVAEIAGAAGWRAPDADLLARYDAATGAGIGAMEARLKVQDPGPLPSRAAVLHCWRGGLRSRSVVSFLRALGMDGTAGAPAAIGLHKGYKGYRAQVCADLKAPPPGRAWVLRGLTGVGKTRVLRALAEALAGDDAIRVIDLEGLAQHRASLLGGVGLAAASQKAFDSGLRAALAEARAARHLVYEGESRRIGNVMLPDSVWHHLNGGTDLLLEADEDHRVAVLRGDYGLTGPDAAGQRAQIRAILPDLERRLGPTSFTGRLTGLLDRGATDPAADAELVRILLARWYDPRYLHGEKGRPAPAARFDASEPETCANAIATHIRTAAAAAGSDLR